MEKQRNSNLDIVRGLAVIFVVFIHIRFPGKLGTIGSDLGGLCNALFFLISGYFVLNNTRKKIVYKALRSFALVIISYLFYATIYQDSVATIVCGLPDILIGNVNRCGNLWFAVALVYCYILYYFLGDTNIKYMLILLVIVETLYSTYCPYVYRPIWATAFYGVPLFFLGNYLAQKKLGGGYNKLFICGIIFGVLLSFSNLADGLVPARLNMLGTVIYAFSVFMWAIFVPEISYKNVIFRIISLIGRKHYVYFYVFQYITISIVKACIYILVFKIYDVFGIEISFVDYVIPLGVVAALYIESLLLNNIWSLLKMYLNKAKIWKNMSG